ncbi:MAG: hypothetical protein ACRDJG_13300 [Actinomycetota bacterium]
MFIGLVIIVPVAFGIMLLAGTVFLWLFAEAIDRVINLVIKLLPVLGAVAVGGLAMWLRGALVRRRAGPSPAPVRRDLHEIRRRGGALPTRGQVRDIRAGVPPKARVLPFHSSVLDLPCEPTASARTDVD